MRWWQLVFLVLRSLLQPATAQSSLTQEFDQLLLSQFKASEPGGVVMVAKNGQVIYKRAFGMANLELGVLTNDSMIYYIGSNSKQFTAIAILQLIEKGKLHLEDSLAKFIPSAPPQVSSISVQQLLSHTSGINDKNEKEIKTLFSAEQKNSLPLMPIAPGTTWEYNNANYTLLGYIIEKLTGINYAEYITENIFRPAGMLHSYVDNEASIILNRVAGYRNFKGRFQNSRPSSKIGAAGGIQSCVSDLLKWNNALKNASLLKSETLQKAYQPQLLLDEAKTTYGFGWYLEELHGSPTRRHGGMVPGYTAETLYFPEEDVYVVILTNTEFSTIPITALARILGGLAIGKPYIFKNSPIDQKELKKYVGVYENDLGEQLNIAERDGRLVFQRPNGAPYKLGYAGGDEFFLDVNFMRVNFVAGNDGKIESLKFSKVDVGATTWFKTKRSLLKLSPERIADSLLTYYSGHYISLIGDSILINRDGPNLYLKMGDRELLLAAADSAEFFSLTEDLKVRFPKNSVTNHVSLLLVHKGKKIKYFKRRRQL